MSNRTTGVGFLIIKHSNGQVNKSLLCAAKLALTNAPLLIQCTDNNLQQLLPLPNLLNPITDCVANIKGLHTPFKKLTHHAIQGRVLRHLIPVIVENHPELLLARQQRIQQLPNP
ncbi:hypothetical protein V8G54_012926 [Vigna mungo]|uniref:Uncharacterized protein n=1 Tax=Vigna mungo TaxID=3915 RepID=A0AAQ3NS63_VIGMU